MPSNGMKLKRSYLWQVEIKLGLGGFSPVRTGLFLVKLTETMVTFPILSPVRTAWDVFLSVTSPESSGYFYRPTAAQENLPGAQENLPGHFSRDD